MRVREKSSKIIYVIDFVFYVGLFILIMTACATFQDTAYKTLAISNASYEQSYKEFAILHNQGTINDAIFTQSKTLANKVHDALETYQTALVAYASVKSADNQDKVNVAMTQLSNCINAFQTYVEPYLSGGK